MSVMGGKPNNSFLHRMPRFSKPVLFLFFATLYFLRMYWYLRDAQPLCEDGTVFFVDAYNDGWHSIFRSYAGYIVFSQRLIAWFTSLATPDRLLFWYSAFAAAVYLGVLWSVLHCRAIRFPSLAAAALVLAPFDGTIVANMTNSQWVLAIVLLLGLIWKDPEDNAIGNLLLLSIAALTGPFSVLLAPLYALRVALQWKVRQLTTRTIVAALCVCIPAALQLWFVHLGYESRVMGAIKISDPQWVPAFLSVFLSPITNAGFAKEFGGPSILIAIVTATYIVLLLYAAIRQQKNWNAFVLTCAAVILGCAALAAYTGDPDTLLYRPRYGFLPTICLAWASLEAFNTDKNYGCALYPAFSLVFGLLLFFSPPLANFNWVGRSACIGGDTACEIPVNWPGRFIHYSPDEPSGSAGRRGRVWQGHRK